MEKQRQNVVIQQIFQCDVFIALLLGHKKCADATIFCFSHWLFYLGLSHEEILAQSILFFLGGYESTANTLSLFGYCLAINPDVQERLIKEIDEVMKDHVCTHSYTHLVI